MIFQNLISRFSKTQNKCFSISDFGLKQYRKASTYLIKEAKKSPLILLLDLDLWQKRNDKRVMTYANKRKSDKSNGCLTGFSRSFHPYNKQ